jgi:hypothetical protein
MVRVSCSVASKHAKRVVAPSIRGSGCSTVTASTFVRWTLDAGRWTLDASTTPLTKGLSGPPEPFMTTSESSRVCRDAAFSGWLISSKRQSARDLCASGFYMDSPIADWQRVTQPMRRKLPLLRLASIDQTLCRRTVTVGLEAFVKLHNIQQENKIVVSAGFAASSFIHQCNCFTNEEEKVRGAIADGRTSQKVSASQTVCVSPQARVDKEGARTHITSRNFRNCWWMRPKHFNTVS